MQTTFTPLQWKNGINPKSQGSFQNFMKQLADWGNSIQQQVVSLQSQINAQAFNPLSQAFGTVTTSQSIDCTGGSSVVVSLSINASTLTLTLNNLGTGVPVWIVMMNIIPTVTFKIVANTPAAAAYTVTAITTGSGGSFNMASGFTTTPGVTSWIFSGNSLSSGPNLYLSLV